MQIKISSGDYEIIDSGVVYAFQEEFDVTFHFVGNEKFKFNVKLIFKKSETEEQSIESNVEKENIELTCINFRESGTGINTPIELATFQGQKIYFKFWNYLEGGNSQNKKTRKIEYTFFAGKRV